MQHYICMGNSLYANRHVSVLKLWKHFYGIEFRFHHELCWAAIVVRDLQFPFGGTNCLQFCETYTKFTFEKDDDEEEGNNRGMILNFTSCKFSFEIRLQYHQTVHIPHDCIIISFFFVFSRDDLEKWPIHEISTNERERERRGIKGLYLIIIKKCSRAQTNINSTHAYDFSVNFLPLSIPRLCWIKLSFWWCEWQ